MSSSPNVPTVLLTVKDASAMLRCKVALINRLIKVGELPKPIKVGNRRLFLQSDVVGYIASKLEATRGPAYGQEQTNVAA